MQTRSSRSSESRDSLATRLLFFFAMLFVCGALFFGYQIYDTVREAVITLGLPDIGTLPGVVAAPPQPTPAKPPDIAVGERVNVLVMGTDCRPIDKHVCRTDTMMIVTFDPKTSTAGVVTIPRDLYVSIPGVGDNRINTANYYGEAYKLAGGGPALAKRTVEFNFGRRIHYYVLVDFTGFRKVIDALGGIDIDVPKAIDDPCYPDENNGCGPLHIPAGRIHMDGELALKYARTRHVDNDFGRSRRQIEVLKAMREKALRLDIVTKLPSLLQSMWGTVETDMQPQEILALAQAASKVKTENIKSASIDQTMTVEFITSTGADVLWPDRVKIGQLLDQIIPPEISSVDQATKIRQEAARILVLNGTKNVQFAERTAKLLQAQGYQIYAYGNADRFDYAKTVLIDYNGTKNATLTELAKLLRVAPENIRRSPNVASDVDLRVILGADWAAVLDKMP